jgi:hypothetical protein
MYNINYSSTDAQAYENIDCFLSSNLYNFELRTAIIAKKNTSSLKWKGQITVNS